MGDSPVVYVTMAPSALWFPIATPPDALGGNGDAEMGMVIGMVMVM